MFIFENAHVLHQHYKELTGDSPPKYYIPPIDEDNEEEIDVGQSDFNKKFWFSYSALLI